jgi:hypothetical protein
MTITSLWEQFGLRGTPFFQDELRPSDEDGYPITLFVGRSEELRRITRRVVSDRSSRTIVQGEAGFGKTSFVNRLKSDLGAAGIITHEHPIRITSDTTRSTFVADVLRTLVRIRLAAIPEVQDRFWKRIVRLLEGEEMTGGSLAAFGVGAGVTRGYIAPQAPGDSLFEHLGEALRRVFAEFGTSVLLHVNNLENLSREGARDTAFLLRDLRDYLLLPGAHWVFVGATGVEDSVFRVHPQVGGIFPEAETLAPLEPGEIEELLARRYEHLSLKPPARMVPPVEPGEASRLYSLYQGDLRNFLRLLGDAAERGLGLRGLEPMTAEEVLRHAAPGYERSLRRRIGEGDFAHLAKLLAASGSAVPEFRVTDVSGILKLAQPSASALMERLLRGAAIRLSHARGRSVYYRPTGEALVVFGNSAAAPAR